MKIKEHRCDGCMYDEPIYLEKECAQRWERCKNLDPQIDCRIPDDRCLEVYHEEQL